jgi:hypothetical protein
MAKVVPVHKEEVILMFIGVRKARKIGKSELAAKDFL